jgi:hypothetical protein
VSNERFKKVELIAAGIERPALQVFLTVSSSALAQAAKLPEAEKLAANWAAALLASLQAPSRELRESPEL